ncbi:reverse transcriptase domain-containing protein [Tanacetum coccineum]
MKKEDEHKTTFHAPKGVYSYKKMPFGLKNTGTTYQRLVDKVFKSRIGRNMEAYVEDMVIKSMDEEDMLADIQETFEREIPTIPQNTKRVPRKERFHVDKRSRQSFRRHEEVHKKTSHSRGTKSRRRPDRILRSLKGAELNYQTMGKLIIALIHAARRLKRYIQAHKITVLTNKPIRLLLLKPEKSRRMARWAIELEEQKIEYKPRNAIKAQVLADNLTETQEEDKETDSQDQEVQCIKRNQNKKANALSKLTSLTFEQFTKKVLVEKLANKSIYEKQVAEIVTEKEDS